MKEPDYKIRLTKIDLIDPASEGIRVFQYERAQCCYPVAGSCHWAEWWTICNARLPWSPNSAISGTCQSHMCKKPGIVMGEESNTGAAVGPVVPYIMVDGWSDLHRFSVSGSVVHLCVNRWLTLLFIGFVLAEKLTAPDVSGIVSVAIRVGWVSMLDLCHQLCLSAILPR